MKTFRLCTAGGGQLNLSADDITIVDGWVTLHIGEITVAQFAEHTILSWRSTGECLPSDIATSVVC